MGRGSGEAKSVSDVEFSKCRVVVVWVVFRGVRLTRDKKGVFRRETGLNLAQNRLKSDVLKHDKTGHLRCPNVLL